MNVPWSRDKTMRMLVMVAGVAVAVCAISDQSFWIDEVHTAWKACQPTLRQWWGELLAERGSDMQMPLYTVYAWSWEKIFGCTEWWLRAANIPWLLLGFSVLARRRADVVLAAFVSPFVWYYAGEARPYAMQIGASLLVFAGLERLSRENDGVPRGDERKWSLWLSGGLLLLAGSSLVAMYWAGVAVGVTLVAVPVARVARQVRAAWPVWTLAAAASLALAGYYTWTLRSGASPYSGSPSDFKNLLFVGYEMLGFSGLGPGRLELRASGLAPLRAYLVPLVIYGCLLSAVLWSAAKCLNASVHRRAVIAAAALLLGATLALLAAGHLRHVRLLGRHFAPLIPCVLWCVAAGLLTLWRDGRRTRRAVVIAFVVLSLASCLSVRFAARHARDSYREVAAEAREALDRGEVVWWNADSIGGQFYRVSLSEAVPAATGQAWLVSNPEGGTLEHVASPDLVIASKPDLYDETGRLAEYLERNRFRAVSTRPAFTLWRR